jgi:hypothetical protein
MKKTLSISLLILPTVLCLVGCSSDTPTSTAAEKKAFNGGPPPADYMKSVNAGEEAARKGAAKAAADHSK